MQIQSPIRFGAQPFVQAKASPKTFQSRPSFGLTPNSPQADLPARPAMPALSLGLLFGAKKLPPEEKALREFNRRAAEIADFGVIAGEYGLQGEITTGRPENPDLEARSGRRLGRMADLISRKFRAKKMGELLRYLNQPEVFARLERKDQVRVKEWLESYEETIKLPADFSRRSAEVFSAAGPAWRTARAKNDYSIFAPHLVNILKLEQEAANITSAGSGKTPYDVLLDNHEEGFTTDVLDPVFARLRQEISPLIRAIQTSPQSQKTYPFMDEAVSAEEMNRVIGFDNSQTLDEWQTRPRAFLEQIVMDMGLDPSRLRVSRSAHPFMSGLDSPFDVRFVVRPTPNQATVADVVEQILGGLHESGHAIFEQKFADKLADTGLAGGTLGIHESQSRLWENRVGRSKAFWQHYFPLLQKALPKQLGNVTVDEFYQAINQVKPSPIRVEADELTYNQHIMVRYELEKEILNSQDPEATIARLPEAWKDKMAQYVSFRPATDAEGVLQDVHWSSGGFGYFPSYTLGNLGASQFYRAAEDAIGKQTLDAAIGSGNLRVLSDWLTENIYKNGAIESYQEILERVTGKPLSADEFIQDMKAKYSALYGLNPSNP